jgi:hypothetical protein
MPLSGEAIRMMNYIDDIWVGDYLKASSPSADEAMTALNLK